MSGSNINSIFNFLITIMKSKFSYKALLTISLIVALSCCLIGFVNFIYNKPVRPPILHIIPVALFFSLILGWLFFGEFRTKTIKVIFENDKIIIKNYGGLISGKSYSYSEIDGFKISFLPSGSGFYEYLYILKNGRKIAKLSAWYHKNYFDLKEYLKSKTKDLGEERFSYWDEIKESFS